MPGRFCRFSLQLRENALIIFEEQSFCHRKEDDYAVFADAAGNHHIRRI